MAKIEESNRNEGEIMTDLKEHAHLFANGKFSIRQGDKNGNFTIYSPVDWGIDEGEICLFSKSNLGEVHTVRYPLLEQCTLIARPISDMTDEEIIELFPDWYDRPDVGRHQIEVSCNTGGLSFWGAMSLLSIGCYPFNQNHLATGQVIGTTKIDQ